MTQKSPVFGYEVYIELQEFGIDGIEWTMSGFLGSPHRLSLWPFRFPNFSTPQSPIILLWVFHNKNIVQHVEALVMICDRAFKVS